MHTFSDKGSLDTYQCTDVMNNTASSCTIAIAQNDTEMRCSEKNKEIVLAI